MKQKKQRIRAEWLAVLSATLLASSNSVERGPHEYSNHEITKPTSSRCRSCQLATHMESKTMSYDAR